MKSISDSIVMAIDDEEVDLDQIVAALDDDFQVVVATDGATALEDIARQLPDLILLDVVMPGMDGHEVCRRLKADPSTRDIPVIFITVKDETEDEAHGFALGAVDYISKPFNQTIVRARVRTHLELLQQRNQLRESISRIEHEAEILRQKADLGIQAGALAHDLNNILVVTCSVKYLPELIPDGVPGRDQLKKDVAMIMENMKLGCEICRGYTSYLRDIDEHATVQPVPPLLQPLDMYARKFPGKLERDIATDVPPVCCKGHQLKRVFMNLFVNAMQAVENREDPWISIRLWGGGACVYFTISDNGPGIPAAIMPRIFEERFTTKKEGTGLGLFLAKQIVDAHQGTIEARSPVGGGATFVLSFPAATGDQEI